jgi:hypothetical protein
MSPAVTSLLGTVSGSDADTTCFSVISELDPGVLPRVLEQIARRGLTPTYCCARAAGGELTVDLQMPGLTPDQAAHLVACFRQIPAVATVLICKRG